MIDPLTGALVFLGGSFVVSHLVASARPFALHPVDLARVAWRDGQSFPGSRYGNRSDPFDPTKIAFHSGQDYRVPRGTPLLSISRGVVRTVGQDSRSGIFVVVDSVDHPRYAFSYAHMDSVDVARGQEVAAGEIVGESGNTGNSTGPHLHFSVFLDGSRIDPLSVLPHCSPPRGNA